MMVVIADDFSGAAEIAGICLNYGLKVSFCMDEVIHDAEDVIIISTDSRSKKLMEALTIVGNITKEAVKLKPDWVYKKIDSVLRGFVTEEAAVQMRLLGLDKCVLIPANPSLGRTIKNGTYFINEVDIAQTEFADDPEFPVSSSDVKSILRNRNINLLKKGNVIENGLNIAEVESTGDVNDWADKVGSDCLPAGSGDFFNALLKRNLHQQKLNISPEIRTPHLYVCGTASVKSNTLLRNLNYNVVAYITAEMVAANKAGSQWIQEAGKILKSHQKLIIAFDPSINSCHFNAVDLRNAMATIVKNVIDKFSFREILIEGGSTASAIFAMLEIKKVNPVYEWSRGVLLMKAEDLNVVVKPGSYQLPEEIIKLYEFQMKKQDK